MPFEEVSRDKKLDALTLLAKGHEPADSAIATGISESTINSAKSKLKKNGTIDVTPKKRGPNPVMGPGIQDVCFYSCYLD